MAAPFDTPDAPLWVEEVSFVDRGYNNSQELHLLQPGEAARLLNIDPTFTGRLQKRQGDAPSYGSAGLANPNGLHAFEAPLKNLQLLVGQWGSELYSTPGDGVLTRRASNVSLANTIYASALGRGNAALPTLFLASCVGVTDNVSLPFGRLVCLDSNFGVTETDLRARAIAWFQNRLWHFNTAASGPNIVGWTKPLDGRDNSNGQTFEVDPDNGDQGIAIFPMRDATPRLLLFKERSIHMVEIFWASDGFYPTTANAIDFTKSLLRPITMQTGLVGTRAAVWATNTGSPNADLLFLSREGIRSLSRAQDDSQGGAGLPISNRIKSTIDRINWTHADRSAAIFWDNKAYWSLPVDGSDRPNFVLAYDVTKDAFFELDSPISNWAPCEIQNERSLFFMSATSGSETGIFGSSGATNGYHIYRAQSSLVDPFGLPVEFDFQTRAFDFSNALGASGAGLRIKKKLNYATFAIQAAATHASLAIQYKLDDDDVWSDLASMYVDPQDGFPFLPVQLPFSFSTGRLIRRDLLLRDLRPCYKVQFRVNDSTSFARLKLISISVYSNPVNPKFQSVG